MIFLLGTLAATAQKLPEKGVPLLVNFTPSDYYNKGKVWDIRSAHSGIVYMAADKGLLEYDGNTWNSYKGSNGFTRSLLLVNDSLIYTGSDLDFGVWKKNKYQAFEYTSLYPFQKDANDVNEEFWDVHQLKENIIFVSSQNIYVYKNGQLTQIAAPYKFSGSFEVNGALYFADEKFGLYTFNGLSLKKVFDYPAGTSFQISGIYEYKEGIVLVTKNSGLYFYSAGKISPLDNALSENLKIANVFCFEVIGESYLAFGTVLKGLYIADLDGNIIHCINKYKGLPNNTVLGLHYSQSGKLWMGMDYGVSALDLRNNLTYFFDYRGDFGTGYTALLKDGIFYLGTNQGLYMSKWEGLNNDTDFIGFQLVPETEGQVWTLENIGGDLFIGHDQGLFVLKGNAIQQLSSEHGVWTILPYKDYLLTGNYNGISTFKKSGNRWEFFKKMELILGSCNQVIVEKDNILWINIPNYGIIRAVLDSNLYPSERLIFPESSFEGDDPCLIRNNEGIHVVTGKFQYAFNATEKKFTHKTEILSYPRVGALLSGVYQPVALHPDYEFYPVFNGFALKYLTNVEKQSGPVNSLVLRKIEAFSNEENILFYPGAKIPYRLNNLRIEFIVPNQDDVLYQYQLNNSGEWRDWSPDNSFEFFGLRHGTHTLVLQAKVNGVITEAASVSFSIAAPWYFSWYAWFFYVLLLIFMVGLIRGWQKRSLKKQKEKFLIKEQESLREQAEKHEQEIMILEQERQKNELDHLKQQLRTKTVELANKAKDNEDKNRLLLTLKEKLDSAQNNPAVSKMRWREIQALLDSYLKVEDKTFEIQMDELHQEFYKKLKEKFPALSVNDLRWCVYLKIGLNTKEIADMLKILPSSAFITRSRLRKKLDLTAEEDLHDFLNNL